MPFRSRFGRLLLLTLLVASSARATVPLEGQLAAKRDCPAVSSIKRGTNPGGLRLTPGRSYPLLGKNRSDSATHYQIRFEGGQPSERWVEIGCGSRVADSAAASVASPRTPPQPAPERETAPGGAYVLAASWQQAFCEIRPYRSECREGATAAAEPDRFSLHGLWPQPRDNVYCGVPAAERGLSERGLWRRLPALDLEDATRARLNRVMPGAISYLHRHEWTKHGTCYGTGEDAYFRHAMSLLDQLNGSPVRALLASNVGRHVSSRQIRDAFDQAFGRGAGERVKVSCSDGMITELRVGLEGAISEDTTLEELVRRGRRVSAGCRGGRVDAAGVGR